MSAEYLEKVQEKYGPIDQSLLNELENALAVLPSFDTAPVFNDPELDRESDVTKTFIVSRALRYVAKQLHIEFDHPDLIGKLQFRDATPRNGGEEHLVIDLASTLKWYQSMFYSMLSLAQRATETGVAAMFEQQRAMGAAFFQHEPLALHHDDRRRAQDAATQASSTSQAGQPAATSEARAANATTVNRSALSHS